MQHHSAILGLGSNMGDRMGFLSHAVSLLASEVLADVSLSAVYASDAEVPEGADASYHLPFYNMAVGGLTDLPPKALLDKIREIERKIGFHDHSRKWAPREIDIDILAFDEVVLSDDTLTIPHPHLMHRPFALLPLLDIAPDWKCPITSKLASLIAQEWKKNTLPFGTIKTNERITL